VIVATLTVARTKLGSLVEEFDRDTVAVRSRIRELLERDPQGFHDAIAPVMNASGNSRGVQFIVGLLVSSNALVPALCNPALSLQQAVSLARMAYQIDPMMDVKLAKQLAEDASMGETVDKVGRLLDVLGQTSTEARISASLARLSGSLMRHLRNPDPEVRSKAVLLIGRTSKNVKWVQSRMAEPDPRTRANAVESIWGVDTSEAKELLRAALRDTNNRVAGNSLFALYRMGDTWVIPEIFKMAASESELFRSSAAWVMGETGDPRFSETLGRMLAEPNGVVRKRAFSALSRLKAAVAKSRQSGAWRMLASLLPGSGNLRHIRLQVSPMDGSELPRLLPTQFILSVDGQPVTQYQVEARTPAESLAVTFLFPRMADSSNLPWVQGAIDSLPAKRPSDLWNASFYAPAGEPPPTTAPDPPQFTANNEEAAAMLQKPTGQIECPSLWGGIRNSVQAAGEPASGVRNLIVYNQSEVEAPPELAEIIAEAVSSNTTVQVVSPVRNEPLEELCRSTQGSFHLASSELESAKLIEEAHLTLFSRFVLSCQPGAGARELNVRVFDPAGWGETTIML
jgi:hypothetical protein